MVAMKWPGTYKVPSLIPDGRCFSFLLSLIFFLFCFFPSYCSFVLFLSISVINLYIFFPTALNISLFSNCLTFLQSAAIYVFVVRYRVGTGIDFI